MQVFFSTVARSRPLKQSGELVRLDWESKKVYRRVPVFPANPELDDPNPRGNTRGGRGIEILGDMVVVASYHSLKIYDKELRHQRDVSHPLMVGLHESYSCTDNRIWVCCTAIDAALEVDLKTGQSIRQFWPREMPRFQRTLGLVPLEIDKRADNRHRFLSRKHLEHPSHLHLNAIASFRGEMYALFHHFGTIVNLDREEVVIKEPALRGGHNLVIRDDGLTIVNDTYGRTVRIYDLETKTLKQVVDLTNLPWIRALVRWLDAVYFMKRAVKKIGFSRISLHRPLFIRGLDQVEDLLFVGLSPASILCIDWRCGELVDAYCYSTRVHVCIHGLKVLTD